MESVISCASSVRLEISPMNSSHEGKAQSSIVASSEQHMDFRPFGGSGGPMRIRGNDGQGHTEDRH
jgi:hypothetical protein